MKVLHGLLLSFLLLFLSTCDLLKPITKPTTPQQAITDGTHYDYWIHSPLHPDQRKPLSFKMKASDDWGIIKVQLYIYEYELYLDEDQLPSKRKRTGGEWGLVKTWDFPENDQEVVLEYKHNKGFKDGSNVEYIFKVINTNNEESERLALFDAGRSPWPNDKITLYATTREPLKSTINVCFFPDTDYGRNWSLFKSDMEKLIYEGYHENNKIKEKKQHWNFYYTQQEASGLSIISDPFNQSNYPPFLKESLITGIDAFGLLHKNRYSDGAYLLGNFSFLSYNMFTSESYNLGTAVHETAHAIFNLSDEYDECVCFESPDGGANVFTTLQACQAFNLRHNFPTSECSVIGSRDGKTWYMSEKMAQFNTLAECESFNRKNGYDIKSCELLIDVDARQWYRSLDGLCIMQDDGDDQIRDFKRTCGALVDEFYEKLEREKDDVTFAATDDVENMFGYEPVVLLELDLNKSQWGVNVKEIQYGVPDKNFVNRKGLDLKLVSKSGIQKHQMTLDDPSSFRIHAPAKDKVDHCGNTSCLVSVPYQKDLAKVTCKMASQLPEGLTPKSVEMNREQEYDIQDELQQAFNKFNKNQK